MIQTVGVVGSGVMGSDVALDLACYGYEVVLKDISEDAVRRAKEKIRTDFRLLKMVKPRAKQLALEDVLGRITFTTSYDGFGRVQFVIENITEDWERKKTVYKELAEVCGIDTYFAVNTSCISITKVGALMPRPDKVIGMHFMNPVPMKELVEVIRGEHTSDESVACGEQFLRSFDKVPVVVNDFPGFVTNRVLMLTINECVWAVQDGVAEPQDVDKIFRLGFGHKMGPLATCDLIGLDTILNSLLVLYDSYKDPKFRPCPLLVKMVDAGYLGKKSGKGFFDYDKWGGIDNGESRGKGQGSEVRRMGS
ncbi:3-hydroxyacyl-CoA dehydrogenase NAD-binding domain-containing protein [Paenibacillus dendritiformis]|uniref:3-hydroxyacyl-CoA dehydrogenase family protein n=1 Tax=Paenibacillus dendritiformis TaxID=130049 RepID=UPI00248D0675|nr:3-hydroxyacyl-CoA dehydrogenase NAD-binding domain-containing protein [Paenibacillus dendritiformis]WGU96905.1 3-hydroxyacyl-CoA dehydrogenase NAD-binding domain-containing protein [Paenibacillus dendritiformis]